MARLPNYPTGPQLPDDAVDSNYGNPTRYHPGVTPINTDRFTLNALFMLLSSEPSLSRDDEEYDGPADSPFSVAFTALPLIRQGDLNKGDVIYRLPGEQNAVCVVDDPETANNTVAVTQFELEQPVSETTAGDIDPDKSSLELDWSTVENEYTYITHQSSETQSDSRSEKEYSGALPNTGGPGTVQVTEPSGRTYELSPRQDISNRSPSGLSWGFTGSGPRQLAVALIADVYDDETARDASLTYEVMDQITKNLDNSFSISASAIEAVVEDAQSN